MGRPRTRPLLSARRYISAALSVTTSGRFRRPESPLSWLIARERFRAIDEPADARSWVCRSRQSWRLSSALMFGLYEWEREIIVERLLSNAENRPSGPD